jgi:hypothetical protein
MTAKVILRHVGVGDHARVRCARLTYLPDWEYAPDRTDDDDELSKIAMRDVSVFRERRKCSS